jgi:YidC/Oxa1 family membrane protein insertase
MKNKETIIGWVLIALIMIGIVFYSSNKAQKEEAKRKTEQALKAKNTPAPSSPTISSALADSTTSSTNPAQPVFSTDSASATNTAQYGSFAAAFTGIEQTFVLENDVMKVTLSNKGAQIKSVELKKYLTWDKKPLILLTDKSNKLSYQFSIDGDKTIDTKDMYFETADAAFEVKGKEKKSFSLRLKAGDNSYFEQKYTLTGDEYMLGYDINLVGMDKVIPANNTFISVDWENSLKPLEHNLELERRYSALYFKYKESDVNHLDEDKESDESVFDAPVEWISFKQQFFNAALFSNGSFNKGKLSSNFTKDNTRSVKKYTAKFIMPYNSSGNVSYKLSYYFGPNHFNTLKSYDKDFESIIKMAPNMFPFSLIGYITRLIIWVFHLFQNLNLNYGIVILLLTLMLKIVLHPLTSKSIESAAKMKILAPELAALREKYGEDQTRMGQEQMKLYQRAGVSPFGGCLPLLLQMPILMAMYYLFPASIELRQESFLWATDLSSYDAVITWATPIFGQNHLSLFTVLMTITSIIQAVMNNQMNSMGNQQPGMKYLPYIMPLFLMFVFNSFPAALTYYYLLQNLLGVAHQLIIQKFFINEEKLRQQIEEHKKNPKPKSGFQKRLEEMQKQNQTRATGKK